MKKIIIVLSVLFYIFSIPVFASEEDILKEPIKEVEEIEQDQNFLKGFGNINNTRSIVSNPMQAKTINFTCNDIACWIDVTSLNIGDKYRVIITANEIGHVSGYKNSLGYPNVGYFVRGYEVLNSDFTWYLNNNQFSGRILQFEDQSYGSWGSQYVQGVYEIYNEPTPEPEEPEVDTEIISGNEILREILRTNREINENVKGIYQYISNNSVSDSVLSDNSVSDNIIYKRLEDYSTSESLALIGLVLAFGALVIYLIHKTVFKIRR